MQTKSSSNPGEVSFIISPTDKHTALQWAEVISDEIINISDNAEKAKTDEATEFKTRLVTLSTASVQHMMDHQQSMIDHDRIDLDLPYDIEDYTKELVANIADLARRYSFTDHFTLNGTYD